MTNACLLAAYRSMLASRRFDEICGRMIADGDAVPHFHSGVGQEALSVGAVIDLRPDDKLIYTHRGYAHVLAKGISLETLVLDTFMKAGGTNNGLGGNMHISDRARGVIGREGAFGSRFGIAVGLALAHLRDETDDVVMCFYGEAAGARGLLYEAMNMAVLWDLPIVFVAENNGWSFSSRTEWLFPEGRMARVWRGFDIPVSEVDGNSIEAVNEAASMAVRRARRGEGPSVIEGMTYRVDPHIWFDKAAYQPPDEIAKWRERDPVRSVRELMGDRGVPQADVGAVDDAIAAEMNAAFGMLETVRNGDWADNGKVVVR